MREFYKERSVVMEERRMRTDSQPTGRLVEQFLGTAFMANPYHRPTIGYASDLQSFSATDAAEFFQRYYVPSNMVIALVGDLDPDKVMPIVEEYFGQLPTAPKPVGAYTIEPPQNSVRQVTLQDPSQPFYLEGYHRPSYLAPDDVVYDAISDILSNGRTSRLYRSLVRDQQIAAFAAGFCGFPGSKYAHLFAFYAVPIPGHTNDELQKAIHEQIEKLKTQDVTDDELQMFKTRTKADLIRGLASNEGLAQQLAFYQTRYGDWRELFRYLDRVDKVTKADIRRVANQAFQDDEPHGRHHRNANGIAPARTAGSRRQRSGTAMSARRARLHTSRVILSEARSANLDVASASLRLANCSRRACRCLLLRSARRVSLGSAANSLEQDPGAAAAGLHAAAADARSAGERHGHLPSA